MTKNELGIQTRRQAISLGVATLAAGTAALALGSCASKTPLEQIDGAMAELSKDFNPSDTRLPLGSIVETDFGRWMITGHNVVNFVDGGERYGYDYYGVSWPCGFGFVGDELYRSALINKSDIRSIVYFGLVNDEDRDLRAYIDENYPLGELTRVRTDGASGPVSSEAPAGTEQIMRQQGKRSKELYGDSFNGGLLYTKEHTESTK